MTKYLSKAREQFTDNMDQQEREKYFDMAQLIGRYEANQSIAEEECVTKWFGDMAVYEIRAGITKEQFLAAYEKAGIWKDMDNLGYKYAYLSGFSGDFLMWNNKTEDGTENAFGFDGWDMAKNFVTDVQTAIDKEEPFVNNAVQGEIRRIQRWLERIESEIDSIRELLKDYGIEISEVVPDFGTLEPDLTQKKNYAVKKNRSMEAGIKP